MILLKNNGNLSHALGLYTLAREEYGKGKLLEESKSSSQSNEKCKINSSIFKNHEEKIQKTLECLPKECNQINVRIVIRNNTSNKSTTIRTYPPINKFNDPLYQYLLLQLVLLKL